MSGQPEPEDLDDFVLLGMAGIPEPEILLQVETLTRSPALEGQKRAKELLTYLVSKALAGRVPRPADIARDIFDKEELYADDSIVRNHLRTLRQQLREHYMRYAKPGEIRLYLRAREYIVYAPLRVETSRLRRQRQPVIQHQGDVILEPGSDAEVHHLTMVRGRLDTLSLDVSAWLVVKIPIGIYYPQCRVSRDNQEWEHQIRVGLRIWGTDEGAEYEIQLVAVGRDGDIEFYQYLKAARDGFGFVLPSDSRLLDSKNVVRRDIRTDEKASV